MHAYRTHTCNELTKSNTGQTVRLSGWVHRKRDHGGLVFLDLRDNYGITQCVIDTSHKIFDIVDTLSNETVITITGNVVNRTQETVNSSLKTGDIEIKIEEQ